jgi:hypothetical protein
MIQKQFSLALLSVMLLFVLVSCVKNEYDLDKLSDSKWYPTLAAPLIHSSLTMKNIIRDFDNTHIFVEDNENFIKLVYTGTVFSKTAEELIVIPNQSIAPFAQTFALGGTIPNGDSLSTTFSSTYDFAATGTG